jgi:sialic acid synthase SpsE
MLIVDIGSGHGGKLSTVIDLMTICQSAGSSVKFQFLTEADCAGTRNLPFNRGWLTEIRKIANDTGITIGASIWSESGLNDLVDYRWDFCKFAYSQRHRVDLMAMAVGMMPTYASVHLFDETPVGVKRLWVDPVYPSYIQPPFAEIAERFDGISLHNLNSHILAAEAIHTWGLTAEVHVCMGYDRSTPDQMFALDPERLRRIRG